MKSAESTKEEKESPEIDTPNKEEIDWIEERLLDIYQYDKLKDCDIDYLYNLEYAIEAQLEIFKVVFPREGGLEDLSRAWAAGDDEERRVALTAREQRRLELLKMETRMEIHRAFGHRLELRRKHRGKLANSFADIVNGIANIFSKIP